MSATGPAGTSILEQLPPQWPRDLTPAIGAALRASGEKVVALDDDPTGTQTVFDVPVLTHWSVDDLRAELENDLPAFYLLTNSRGMPLDAARALNAAIGRNLREASKAAGRRVAVISRGDSTLRGHFPGEVEALDQALGGGFDAWFIIPFFAEGGRYTVDDVHYLAEGDRLVPVGETQFAADKSFGYRSSNLREWVEEKTGGRVRRADVASISIADLRQGGPDRVGRRLMDLTRGRICVVNAASNRDLEVFTLASLRAEAAGKRFLYRTAASFVRVRAGISRRPLLTREELVGDDPAGGLIVVGSYVPLSTGQVGNLLALPHVYPLEVPVPALLAPATGAATIHALSREADEQLAAGRDVVLYTSRELVSGGDAAASLRIGAGVSDGLVAIVRAISTRPRYFLAKGGITSSDMATRALEVRRATVLGQVLPPVPVWRLGPESRHPGLTYIVFPGNVGGPTALADVVSALAGTRGQKAEGSGQETGTRGQRAEGRGQETGDERRVTGDG